MIELVNVQDSYSPLTDSRITTFQWDYPRFVHGEVMTHRVFSRNAGSSRAIPVMSAIDIAAERMVEPLFRKNKPGMQPGEYLSAADLATATKIWRDCAHSCIEAAKELNSLKVHKQWANRMLEWFSPIRIAVTSTDWDNFLWLRNDFEAQDEIWQLAELVENSLSVSKPLTLQPGDAHTPFVDRFVAPGGNIYYKVDGTELLLPQALKVSASVCAQMSYRKNDTSILKSNEMYDRFVQSRRVHSSPFEHQAIAAHADISMVPMHLDKGITHFDRKGRWYSGNFRGMVQYRQLIPNNVCTDLEEARRGER